jgi:hypothetical protein
MLAALSPAPAAAGAQSAPTAAGAQSAPTTAPAPALPEPLPVSRAGGLISRSAHIAFEGCDAQHITVTVLIARDPFPNTLPVTYAVVVTNNGSTPCGPAAASIPSGRGSLTVGPCGQLSGSVLNAAGRNVYPGPLVFSCPMFVGVHLGPHASVTGEGSWVGYEAIPGGPHDTVQWQKAPPGQYRVTVAGAVSVPFSLTGIAPRPASPWTPGLPPTPST